MTEAPRKDILLKLVVTNYENDSFHQTRLQVIMFFFNLNYICWLFFQQTFLVSSQVTFLFVLFLASVNLASANPVCTGDSAHSADSASVKVSPVFIVNSIKLKHM